MSVEFATQQQTNRGIFSFGEKKLVAALIATPKAMFAGRNCANTNLRYAYLFNLQCTRVILNFF
jgi:hypothetical protein